MYYFGKNIVLTTGEKHLRDVNIEKRGCSNCPRWLLGRQRESNGSPGVPEYQKLLLKDVTGRPAVFISYHAMHQLSL